MNQHTPGPWDSEYIDKIKTGIVPSNRSHRVAVVADALNGADTALITAAPGLLEELKAQVDLAERVYNALRDIAPADVVENIIDMLAPHTRTAARAAIAKAEGKV